MSMTGEDYAEISAAIIATMANYVRAVDDYDPDGIAATFCPDGWIQLPRLGPVHGRDAIRAALNRPRTAEQMRHNVSNERVFDIAGDSASALSDLAVIGRPDGSAPWVIQNVGRYIDTFHRGDSGWLIHSRTLVYPP